MRRWRLLALLPFSIACGSDPGPTYGHPAAGHPVVFPFRILADSDHFHLIAFFADHPDYEAIEAFVSLPPAPSQTARIRGVMTYHGGRQDDYVNYEPAPVNPDDPYVRPTYRGAIAFEVAQSQLTSSLRFRLKDGQEAALVYVSDLPVQAPYGGLTDVGNHAPDGGLPLLFRDGSSVGLSQSYVRIGARQYPIIENQAASRPPFFIANEVYLTQGMHSFILLTYLDRYPVERFVPRGDTLILPETPTDGELALRRVDDATEIASATFRIEKPGLSRRFALEFDPPFPDLVALVPGTSASSQFAVRFRPDGPKDCSGECRVRKTAEGVADIELNPLDPGWAWSTRAMRYHVEWDATTVRVTASMRDSAPR
jgi:hypothetical protein